MFGHHLSYKKEYSRAAHFHHTSSSLLASSIWISNDILGINVQDTIHKICQCADDTSLFMSFDGQLVDATFDILKNSKPYPVLK